MTVQTNPSDLFLKCRRWGQIPPHQMQWQMQYTHTHTDAHAHKHKTSTSVLVCLKFPATHSWHCMMFSPGCCHGDGAISCTPAPQLAELIFTEQMRRWFCIYLSFVLFFLAVKFKDVKALIGGWTVLAHMWWSLTTPNICYQFMLIDCCSGICQR